MKRLVIAMVLAVLWTAAASLAAEHVYIKREQVLSRFFASSERVDYARLTLTDAQTRAFSGALGYTAPRKEFVVYFGKTGGTIDGYAVIDNELGKFEPITFAVLARPDGSIGDVAVMVYREEIGHEVKEESYLKQYRGKKFSDPLRTGRDLDGITGATISCHSIAKGVKRALWVVQTYRETAKE
ncbi:MAG: FMN-binding protein [Deltaproteobacteria bacterium]|nr:FMN-binding protein [Deltaproteobacteria bacterium]